jgi:hypothetical protein
VIEDKPLFVGVSGYGCGFTIVELRSCLKELDQLRELEEQWHFLSLSASYREQNFRRAILRKNERVKAL